MCIPHTIYKQRRRRDGTSGRQIIIRNSKTSSAACDYYEIFICGIIKNNKSAVSFRPDKLGCNSSDSLTYSSLNQQTESLAGILAVLLRFSSVSS